MGNKDKKLTDDEVSIRQERRLEAMHLQEIEGNPLTDEEVEMFEMFERERWSTQKCLDYITQSIRERTKPQSK